MTLAGNVNRYTGTFEYNVDGKNRIAVPPRYRENFTGGGFISLRTGYIALYDRVGWGVYLEGLRRLLAEGEVTRKTFNTVLGVTEEISPDGQGRFVLGRLREAHGLGERVTVVGLDNCMGIYRPENAPSLIDDLDDELVIISGLPL